MATVKIDKEFKLTDSSVNCYGFRLMTSGYQLPEFEKNPIGFYMHDRDCGVLLKWEDFRVDGDAVYAKPVINMSHPRAQQTIDEINDGFLNAASVGNLVVLEYTDDTNLKLEGQDGPTVTRWFNRECSLVDIPGNFNALSLFDKDDNPINLADFTTKPIIKNVDMKQLILTAAMLAALNLKAEDATPEMAEQAFKDLVEKKNSLQKELADLKAALTQKEVGAILETALSDKKITKELSAKLAVDYKENPEGLKNLVAALPAYVPVTSQLNAEGTKGEFADLKGKSWTELQEMGVLENIKLKAPDMFKEIYKREFNKEPVL